MVLLLALQHLNAQSSTNKKPVKHYEWGNLGVGFTMERLGSFGNGRNYTFDYTRAVGKMYLQGGVQSFVIYQSEFSLYSFHIAAGYAVRNRLFLYGMFIGPAYQSGFLPNGKFFSALGVSANMPFIFKPLEDLGIGIAVYSNINKKVTDNGMRVMINISSKYDKKIVR